MRISRILLSFAASVLAFSSTAFAQDDDHGIMTVRATTVKAGMGQEYQELQRTLAASRKAAGHSGRAMWQVIRGSVGTFYSVTNVDNYADYGEGFDSGMSDGEWQRWLGRLGDVVEHAQLTTLRTHGELAIAPQSDSAPVMLQLRYTTLKPGTAGAHHAWLAESLVPAMKEGNTAGWNISNVVLGDDVNTWISAMRIDSWEQMDGPGPFSHLGDRDGPALFESYAERAQSARTEVIRFLPDLSY